MKNIFLFLLLIPCIAFSQSSDATLTTQNNSTIAGKIYNPTSAKNMYQGLIDSKVSLSGSYANPSWITSLAGSKISLSGTNRIQFESGGFMTSSAQFLYDVTNGNVQIGSRLKIGALPAYYGSASRRIIAQENSTPFSSLVYPLRLTGVNNIGGATVGGGVGMEYVIGGSGDKVYAEIDAISTNVGAGTEAGDLVFKNINAGTLAETFRIKANGTFSLGGSTGTSGYVLTSNGSSSPPTWQAGGGGGAVSSVFTRTGAVTAQTGDYSFSQISGTVTNAQLAGSIASSKLLGTDIATVGTVTSGTWNGTVIGSAYGGAGSINGILKANGSGTVSAATAGTDYLSTLSATSTVFVDSLSGNNTTGTLNRSDKPFLTIDAALDAGASVKNLRVRIGMGTYASPTYTKLRSNIWFEGSGKPGYNWVISQTAYATFTVTDPTRLRGGTILQGQLRFENLENIHITDLGVDIGSAYITAGGTESNALTIVQYPLAAPPINMMKNVVVKNFTALCKNSSSAFHGLSLENLYEPVIENVDTYFGVHGIAIKCIGGTITNVRGHSHGSDGLIFKSDATALGWATKASNIEEYNCAVGIIYEYAPGGLGNSQVSISNVRLRDCTAGVLIYGTGGSSINFRLDDIHVIRPSAIGIQVTTGSQGSISNCLVRGGTKGFAINLTGTDNSVVLTNCYSSVSTTTGFDLSSVAANGVIVHGVFAETSSGYGITAGANVYGDGYYGNGNSSGNLSGSIIPIPHQKNIISGGTLAGGAATDNYLNVTGTLATTNTNSAIGARFDITGAGSSSQVQSSIVALLNAGYTGSSASNGAQIINASAGTNTTSPTMSSVFGNQGSYARSTGTTTGTNIGVTGQASGGNLNLGGVGQAQTAKNSATNVGGLFLGRNTGTSPVEIGLYAGLNASATLPTFTSAAFIADNDDQAVDILVARDNGTKVFSIPDGGNPTLALGNKFIVTTGSNASAGTGTLSAGTVTISTTAVSANSLIFIQHTSCSSCGVPYISTKTAGTSFVVTSNNGSDASTFNWWIIN